MRKEIRIPLLIWAVFEIIAVVLWLTQENLFYLLNFSYIGTCLSIGLWAIRGKHPIRTPCSPIGGWPLYACVSGNSLPRKHAD